MSDRYRRLPSFLATMGKTTARTFEHDDTDKLFSSSMDSELKRKHVLDAKKYNEEILEQSHVTFEQQQLRHGLTEKEKQHRDLRSKVASKLSPDSFTSSSTYHEQIDSVAAINKRLLELKKGPSPGSAYTKMGHQSSYENSGHLSHMYRGHRTLKPAHNSGLYSTPQSSNHKQGKTTSFEPHDAGIKKKFELQDAKVAPDNKDIYFTVKSSLIDEESTSGMKTKFDRDAYRSSIKPRPANSSSHAAGPPKMEVTLIPEPSNNQGSRVNFFMPPAKETEPSGDGRSHLFSLASSVAHHSTWSNFAKKPTQSTSKHEDLISNKSSEAQSASPIPAQLDNASNSLGQGASPLRRSMGLRPSISQGVSSAPFVNKTKHASHETSTHVYTPAHAHNITETVGSSSNSLLDHLSASTTYKNAHNNTNDQARRVLPIKPSPLINCQDAELNIFTDEIKGADRQAHLASRTNPASANATKAPVTHNICKFETTKYKKTIGSFLREPDTVEEVFDVVGRAELERDDGFSHVGLEGLSIENGKGELSFWEDEEDEEEWFEGWDEGGLAQPKAKVGIGGKKGREVRFENQF